MPDMPPPDGNGSTLITNIGAVIGFIVAAIGGLATYLIKQKSNSEEGRGGRGSRLEVVSADLADSRPIERLTSSIADVASLLRGIKEDTADIKESAAISRASDVELIDIMRERMRQDELRIAREQAFREGEREAQNRRNQFDDAQTQGPHRRGSPNK